MAKFLRKPKRNIALRLAGILFCLTLVSFYMVSGLFAKYMTRGQGSDSARVIKFGNITLTETGDFYEGGNKMWIVPGLDIKKDAKVSFEGSEAATYVFVEVKLSNHWTCSGGVFTMTSGKISWKMASGWQRLSDTVYYQELAPNTALNADIIADGLVTVSDSITRYEMTQIGKIGEKDEKISVTFGAQVVQSNGFASAQAAWESLAGKEGAGL